MKGFYFYILFFTLLLSGSTNIYAAKNQKVDSLIQIIDTTNIDTLKLNALDYLSWELIFNKPDTALIIGKTALSLSASIADTNRIINALNNIATAYAIKGSYVSALKYFDRAIRIAKAKNLSKDLSKIYNNVGLIYWYQGKLDSAIELYNQALKQYKNVKLEVGVAHTYNNLGLIYDDRGNNDSAIGNYKQALAIFDSLGKKGKSVANTINNLGIVFYEEGDYSNAMEYYLKALKLYESINKNSTGHANTLINIGKLYKEQEEYKVSLEYYNQAKKILESISLRSVALAKTLTSIGEIYKLESKNEIAITYLKKALKIQQSIGDKTYGLTQTLRNLAELSLEYKKDYAEAKDYFERALSVQEEIGDRAGKAKSLYSLGLLAIKQGNYWLGVKKCKESFELSKKLALLKVKSYSCDCLGNGYEKLGNPSKALFYYKLFIKNRDSLLNKETTRAITQKAMRYEFEKVQYQDSLKRAEQAKRRELEQREEDLKKEAQINRQRIYTISGGAGFLLMFGLAFVLFRGYKNKQKSNEIITAQKASVEKQKSVIEVKNKEILDSINYAKRIQNTILPDEKDLLKYLGENYVMFRPKDIVSGDFYWVNQQGNETYFSVIDCTGHGVPGALVSIVANNNLNRVLNEFKVNEPAAILDHLNQLVEENFSTTAVSIKDGMDMALCKLNRDTLALEYAGANNPLYIVRQGEEKSPELEQISKRTLQNKEKTTTLYEIAPDKQPVGKFEYRKDFNNRNIQLIKGDCIYIASDGFADQFGGSKGKKYMYKPFKRLILKNASKKMSIQKEIMEDTFDNWKKELEQIDDVCMLGMRV